jgi:hypothetical protein
VLLSRLVRGGSVAGQASSIDATLKEPTTVRT